MREASRDDAEALYELARELAGTLGDQLPQAKSVRARFDELLEEPRARVLIAEDEGGVVGAANLWIKPDLAHGDTVIEVPMLVVSGNARRRGIGKLLVDEIQNIAADENASIVELIATKDNEVPPDLSTGLWVLSRLTTSPWSSSARWRDSPDSLKSREPNFTTLVAMPAGSRRRRRAGGR